MVSSHPAVCVIMDLCLEPTLDSKGPLTYRIGGFLLRFVDRGSAFLGAGQDRPDTALRGFLGGFL